MQQTLLGQRVRYHSGKLTDQLLYLIGPLSLNHPPDYRLCTRGPQQHATGMRQLRFGVGDGPGDFCIVFQLSAIARGDIDHLLRIFFHTLLEFMH